MMRVVHLIGKNAYWREFILCYQKLMSKNFVLLFKLIAGGKKPASGKDSVSFVAGFLDLPC